MGTEMHLAWLIAPTPAVYVEVMDGTVQARPNEAARCLKGAAAWTDRDWAQLGETVHTSMRGTAGPPVEGECPVLGLGWRSLPWADGWLVWLLPVPDAPPANVELSAPPGQGGAPPVPRGGQEDLGRPDVSLKDLAERLDIVQSFGQIGLWERDAQTGIGRWDRHTYRLLGLPESPAPPLLDAAFEVIHPDDRERAREAYEASLSHPGEHHTRYRVLLGDGRLLRLRSSWRVETGPDGRARRAIGILVDETEQLATVARHALTLQQLNLASGLVGITLWRLDLATQRVTFSTAGRWQDGILPNPEGVDIAAVYERLHPQDRETASRAMEQALQTHTAVDLRLRLRDASGRYRDLLTRRIAERDDRGVPVALVGLAVDMTQQVADRARGDAFSARMQLVAEATSIGVWSYDLDTGERHVNAHMRQVFGLGPDEPSPSLRKCLSRIVVPEDAQRVAQMLRKVTGACRLALGIADAGVSADEAPANGEVLETEFRVRQPPQGTVRWLVSRTQVLRHGAQLIAQGVLIDVTDFRATQVALRSANQRVELAAQAAGLGTWQLDLDSGRIQWDEQMYRLRGLSPDDPRPIEELIRSLPPPGESHDVMAMVQTAVREGSPYSNEFRVCWPDGSVRWLASRGTLLTDADGRAERMVGVNWDVTEQKLAEQMQRDKRMAEEASRAKTEFLARMSHELRTPLNAVLGFSELLCAALPGRIADEERAHAELIRSAGRHLLALIDDVLDLARLDAGRVPLAQEPVALDAVLADVVRWVQGEARAAAVAVQAEASGRWVLGDAKALRQVFANLLSNGIKYNRAGGQVRVRVGPSNDTTTQVRVSDTGRGMGPEQLAHLFEPFNRLGAEGGDIQGTGIGLAIVHQLVERMGGRLAVQSLLGQGSEFSLWLPSAAAGRAQAVAAMAADAVESAGRPAASEARAPPPPHLAIYIEDNPVNLLLVRELFERKPAWELHTAEDGRGGLDLARRLRPRLVLIDMQLPDMDGAEVLARLRAEPSLAGVCCIALSANAMPADVARARAEGFDDYWTKPVDFEAFLAALDRLAVDLRP